MVLAVGLLGIVTKVRLKLDRTFNIYGQEATTPITQPGCPIDLFGPGTAAKPSMRKFLEEAPYSRIMWCPQKGAERVVIWQAVRKTASPGESFDPVPYQEFASTLPGWIEQLLGSVFFTLLGNNNPVRIVAKLFRSYARFCTCVANMWSGSMGPVGSRLLAFVVTLLVALICGATIILSGPAAHGELFPSLSHPPADDCERQPTMFGILCAACHDTRRTTSFVTAVTNLIVKNNIPSALTS